MKNTIKLGLLIMTLISCFILSGCGKNDFTGTWVGVNPEGQNLIKLTIQENGDKYIVAEDAYKYKPDKDLPIPKQYSLLAIRNGFKQKQTVTYDFNFILTKEKSPLPSTTATLSEDKEHLIVQGEKLSNILYVPKDDTLVFNNVKFIKVDKNDVITKSLEELKNNSILLIKHKYHKYSERFNLESTDTVKIGNITFDDSALIESK